MGVPYSYKWQKETANSTKLFYLLFLKKWKERRRRRKIIVVFISRMKRKGKRKGRKKEGFNGKERKRGIKRFQRDVVIVSIFIVISPVSTFHHSVTDCIFYFLNYISGIYL